MDAMDYIGIDIGSTAAKVVVLGAHETKFALPSGWSGPQTAQEIHEKLEDLGVDFSSSVVISTGYGRHVVEYAQKEVTEITCHAAGCADAHPDCLLIDVGGQDIKGIHLAQGKVDDFIMNDKCSAGTGKFVEIMAHRLNCGIDELFDLAEQGVPLPLSSLCTVFTESEIIGYMCNGKKREDIAAGIVQSMAEKVALLVQKMPMEKDIILTGGLSHLTYFADSLGKKLKHPVRGIPNGRYAGAYGAALLARAWQP
jgi:predicted CoA-substrate-specific enzyme activase